MVLAYLRAKLNFVAVLSPRKSAELAMEIFTTPLRKAKKKMPPIFEKAESLSFKLHGKKVHGYRWNHPTDRKLLILHGFESSSFNFERYVKPAIRKGYEVVAIDAPAHGKSEGKTIALPDYMATIDLTVKKFGPFHAYLAHSFGGLALSLFLENHPSASRPRIVLIAPATETTTAITSFFAVLQLNEKVKKEFAKLIREKAGVSPAHFSIKRVAPGLEADILWVHDEDDDMTPLKDVKPLMKEVHPHIRFFITKGLGHRRIYRDNQVSRTILDFLA
jgi:alpha-beta hydrolase superfamily lysophospholipase